MSQEQAPEDRPLRWGMFVVFALVGILVVVPMVFVFTDGAGNGYARTQAFVNMLDGACTMYKADFGVFPPMEPFGDSRSLVFYLGREGKGGRVSAPPFVRFRARDLDGEWDGADPEGTPPPVDRWGSRIRYRNPGVRNPGGVDIWSPGRNGADELDPDAADFDDVTNWTNDS